jgi:excisionase family DNA binding protein
MLPARTYVRPDEVAEVLACSERHVRRLCEQGKLYAIRIGEGPKSGIRIGRESVIAYLAEARRAYEEINGLTDNSD